MFGLFKNKEKEKEEVHPEFLALIAKWDTFLEKIETRFNESLANAEVAILDNLEESDYDMSANMTAWSGIKAQIDGLSDKIENTFDEKVGPKMEVYADRGEVIDQDQKGIDLRESFGDRIERFEIILEGKVAKAFYDHAIAFLQEEFQCTQCSGTLDMKKDIFRSHYVSCGYCNTVNTITPKDKIIEIRWIVDNIAKHHAIKEWDEKMAAYNEAISMRSFDEGDDLTPLKLAYEKWEQAELAFWTKYFTERSTFVSEFEETIAHDVDVKMKWAFYDARKRSELNY